MLIEPGKRYKIVDLDGEFECVQIDGSSAIGWIWTKREDLIPAHTTDGRTLHVKGTTWQLDHTKRVIWEIRRFKKHVSYTDKEPDENVKNMCDVTKFIEADE